MTKEQRLVHAFEEQLYRLEWKMLILEAFLAGVPIEYSKVPPGMSTFADRWRIERDRTNVYRPFESPKRRKAP